MRDWLWLIVFVVVMLSVFVLSARGLLAESKATKDAFTTICTEAGGRTAHNGQQWVCLGVNSSLL